MEDTELKNKRNGRRFTKGERARILEKFSKWEGSAGEFCVREGVGCSTLWKWRKNLGVGSGTFRPVFVSNSRIFSDDEGAKNVVAEVEFSSGKKLRLMEGCGSSLASLLVRRLSC